MLVEKLEKAGLKEEAEQLKDWQKMLEGGEESGADLEKAAHDAHALGAKLRAGGHDDLADDVEKVAGMLDAAAHTKLEVEMMQKEKEAKEGLKEAAAEGHAVADKLRAEGKEELADMVDHVVEEVEHALGRDPLDVEEVEHAIEDAKAAAERLRAEGKAEEAEKLDGMVQKLEEALDAQHEAEDLKKEAELMDTADALGRPTDIIEREMAKEHRARRRPLRHGIHHTTLSLRRHSAQSVMRGR